MIAGEQKLIAIQKNGVPFRVARRGDHHHVVRDVDRIASRRLLFDRRRAAADVVAMQDALAAEALVKFLMIGDIVLMRQEHPARAAHRLDVSHERIGKAR